MTSGTPAAPRHDTRADIIDAGIRCLARDGLQATSMGAIATRAGVSKALLHYHFTDRAALLADMTATITQRLVLREQGALSTAQGEPAVDLLWRWVEGELARGELHALLELYGVRDASVCDALAASRLRRHEAARATVSRLFQRLGLIPRVRADLIGNTVMTFVDGLAVDPVPSDDRRTSFDVFWLALLGLGQ
ncbi:MAG: TetR/AcrR family transcriptional regulator [bacterium]